MPRIPFPELGLVEAVASQDQAVGTAFSLQNVRPKDPKEERLGGQRAGTALAYTTRIVGDYPVIDIGAITTTYIVPETP